MNAITIALNQSLIKLLLQQMETITENYSLAKCRE
uniref:TSG-5B n=1 Tax=Mus musculus TaxID=10090 RepID=Q8BFX9_MOUSE|nr:TSG-5B [Mus musculus]AAN39558.1 TSG-5B [Mus musculus]